MLENFQFTPMFGKNLIRIFIFIIFIKSLNSQNVGNANFIDKPERKFKDIFNNITNTFLNFIRNINTNITMTDLSKIIGDDGKCLNFIMDFFKGEQFMDKIAKKVVINGFSSGSMEVEEECLENDEHYFLLIGNISNDTNKSSVQQKLFIESYSYYKEFCLWNVCDKLYAELFKIIRTNLSEILSEKLGYGTIKFEGENYKINNSNLFELNKKQI